MGSTRVDYATEALIGALLGLALLVSGALLGRRALQRARDEAAQLLADARLDAQTHRTELLVAAQERSLALQEEADRREREIEERELRAEARAQELQQESSKLERQQKALSQRTEELERLHRSAGDAARRATELEQTARSTLERIAALTPDEARAEIMAAIEAEARAEAMRLSRRIEEEARENAEHEALNLIVQATQRVNLRDVLESTVSFIELPNDEMKGRIIGKEGRNIRALEMATGIDLIVDDTPRSIWISCFDPLRREIARRAIDRLLEDGRIHPARIEEVVQKVAEEMDGVLDERGHEAAFSLGITELHPKLVRWVGRMRYHTTHGQNLLQHCLETALLAGHMTRELGGQVAVAHRAGLLHEVSRVADPGTDPGPVGAAELCQRFGEAEGVVHAVRSLHPDVPPQSLEALLLATANKLSESRPGARKENLAIFIERLRRLESIAQRFPGVQRAFAVKAGKDLRVLVDVGQVSDEKAYDLSKQIARAVERELSYPGQIRISVVRETRAVRFAV